MTGSERLQKYVNDVLSNPERHPQTIVQACQRFIDDYARGDIYFDVDACDAAIRYIEMFKHVGAAPWFGTNVVLENFQCFWVGSLFGWKWVKNDMRRFRYAYAQIPRKNGKSFIAVCIALLMFGPDSETGAEVFLGATSREHCKDLLFKPASNIVKACEDYKEHYGIEIGATRLTMPSTNSFLTTVIKKPSDGNNPHCAVVDEYHEHETSEQYDTFDTGMGARRQPLLHVVTTAGADQGGPCKAEYDECKRGLRGEIDIDTKFVLIYEPDEGDDWEDEATLRKVNPCMGVSVNEDYLLDQLRIAKTSTDKQNTFRTKHLNQWVGSKVAWMNMLAWQRQKDTSLKIEDFKGEQCHIALDLASKKDLTALSILFKRGEHYYGFEYFFVPEDAVLNNDRYPQFVKRDEISITGDSMTDYSFIEQKILELCNDYDVLSVAYDPFQATYLVARLSEHRLNLIEYGHTVGNMSEPMKLLEACVLDGKYHNDGNSCMSWQIGNVVARLDVKDNIYPNKANRNDERCKIDGVVSLIMAFGRWLDETREVKPYADRGFRTL